MENILFFLIGFLLGIVIYNELEKHRQRSDFYDFVELVEEMEKFKKELVNKK